FLPFQYVSTWPSVLKPVQSHLFHLYRNGNTGSPSSLDLSPRENTKPVAVVPCVLPTPFCPVGQEAHLTLYLPFQGHQGNRCLYGTDCDYHRLLLAIKKARHLQMSSLLQDFLCSTRCLYSNSLECLPTVALVSPAFTELY